MNPSRKRISRRVSLAGGALLAAIAIVVPLVSAGHPAAKGRAARAFRPAAQTVAPARSDASASKPAIEPKEATGREQCDAQLD